ncbi:MAG: ABC transporter ATP-binding protein [Firmicutes bacterium]|nr:ABC transporter ATP-binding protein [Bacillota bacterium]
MGEVKVVALKEANFNLFKGELVVVLGPSGSGKSTLLNIMGGMDTPTRGRVYCGATDIAALNEGQLTSFRRHQVGFVFQFYNLMPNLTVKENVELATEISENPLDVVAVLEQVGLEKRANHFPAQLSGGEQQRVAIARAVAKNPEVLLCDEPTGALDHLTGIKVLRLLCDINQSTGKTVIIITHNQPIAGIADRVIKMSSGEIVEIIENRQRIEPEKVEW